MSLVGCISDWGCVVRELYATHPLAGGVILGKTVLNTKIKFTRVLIFRLLLLLIIGAMFVSFFFPWWAVDIYVPTYEGMPNRPSRVEILGYGLRHNMEELRPYVMDDETPMVQSTLAWVFMGVCALTAILSTAIKYKWRAWTIGLPGVAYLCYALVAIFIVVQNRAEEFGIALTGISGTTYTEGAEVSIGFSANLLWGFYLACASGIFMLIMASLSNIFNPASIDLNK
jgi:hypothetical protein